MTPMPAIDVPGAGYWNPIVRNRTTRSGVAMREAKKSDQGRLIIVSNRLPLTVSSSTEGLSVEASVGGLVTALRKPHQRTGGTWIGWPGEVQATDQDDLSLAQILADGGMVPVHLTTDEVRRYYGDFANGILWPVLHYATGSLPLEIRGWEEYQEVNRRFANAVVEQARPGDTIWIHDYQLLLVPLLVRERLPDVKIGFFLHTPFPSPEVFAVLPNRELLLEGMLGADLIGFHTASYRRHFETTIRRYVGVECDEGSTTFRGRSVRLGVFPVGVDADALAEEARAPAVHDQVRRIRAGGSRILLGIDRLDYTKGIARRLLAFRALLTRWPELQGRVRLIQVGVPSRGELRTYRQLRAEVDRLVGDINGEFSTAGWVPIHYLRHSIDSKEIAALYRAADVMLVTPVRDGMNLVAKEFVASRIDGDGVLVLSEFAGAAAELRDAVFVNPYDVDGAAEAYHRALTMPESERRARMFTMRESVSRNDVDRWVACFLGELAGGERK